MQKEKILHGARRDCATLCASTLILLIFTACGFWDGSADSPHAGSGGLFGGIVTDVSIVLPEENSETVDAPGPLAGAAFYASGAVFAATVHGESNPDQTVAWAIGAAEGGGLGEGTSITGGVLNVAVADHGKSVTITAASVSDDGKSASVTVTIVQCLPSDFYGIWENTTGAYQPYTLGITAGNFHFEDKDKDYINYAGLQWAAAQNTNTDYMDDCPAGYTFTGSRTNQGYAGAANNFGFIALSANKQKLYKGETAATAAKNTVGRVPLYTKQ